MKGIEINIDDIKVSNSFDMTKIVVRFIAMSKNLSLTETEIHALTHFIINGFSKKSREDLVTMKLLKTYNATANLVSNFRKYGLIIKHNLGERISSDFSFNLNDMDGVLIKIKIKK